MVGAGPRGVSILERMLASHPPGRELHVELIDPAVPGPGAHPTTQPDYLLANTVAGQITAFRHDDPSARPGGVAGPSQGEWAGRHRDSYLPRRRLGEYFAFALESMRRQTPPGLDVRSRRARVVRVTRENAGWSVELDDGSAVRADAVVLATGHGQNVLTSADLRLAEFAESVRIAGRSPLFIPRPYPLEELDRVPPGARVAVRGMGLAAIDVVLALTVGRGGRFDRAGRADLTYRPSGAEPVISVFSRHGRAFWPRARNQKSPQDVYRPEVMTVAHVESLRARGKLDFARDVVPLLRGEIRRASARVTPAADLSEIMDSLDAPDAALAREPRDVQRRIAAFYRIDELRATAGNMSDSFKAGADAVRDLRNEIRVAVEHGGLTATSHRQFVEVFAPLLHVISAGPPRVRARQWRALFDAGVLHVAASPASVDVDRDHGVFVLRGAGTPAAPFDAVVHGAVEPFLPSRDTSALVRGLLDDGLARPYRNDGYHPGGFDVDRSGRLIDARGIPHPNLFAVGNPTEGPHYFTNMLPAPGLPSRITKDAEGVVAAVLADAETRSAPSARETLVS